MAPQRTQLTPRFIRSRGINHLVELREACERCDAATPATGEAFICSFECTFCPDCAAALEHVCPNCSGELVRRPRRRDA